MPPLSYDVLPMVGRAGHLAHLLPAPPDCTDWHLPLHEPGQGQCYPGGVHVGAEAAHLAFAQGLVAKAHDRMGADYTVCHEGVTFRVHREETVGGVMLMIRRMPDHPPRIDSLMPESLADLLLHPHLNQGGLVIVCGSVGQGKTTTCSATVVGRLHRFGGVCVTIEDPAEMPIHGRHGEGVCYQTELGADRDLEQAVRASLRCFPVSQSSILMLGEVRDTATAEHLLRASVNGMLVLMTLHAGNVISAIVRLLGLVDHKGEQGHQWRELLASALRLVIHQRLEQGRARFEVLAVPGRTHPAANHIRHGHPELLSSEVQAQARSLMARQDLFNPR